MNSTATTLERPRLPHGDASQRPSADRGPSSRRDRLDRLRNLEPDTAKLMAVLVRATRPARMLELGTSNGYSTIWLADAARAVGAELVSVELDPARSEQARRNLESAGVADNAELRVADAGELRAGSPTLATGRT
jgi:predicted O-methyltransferase YrrM